ncbi:MAG TPA: hypothetical protein VLJ17_16730 [Xanthobacteraceae bacterium]|nr:hypothetical protein [Xanthobacteraceae bacterium]
MTGVKLTSFGSSIVRRGGHDHQSDDDMLLLEIIKRAPGMAKDDLQRCFVAILEEYGADALAAVQSGHVQFEEVRAGARPEGEAQ